jgi:hypothetical protein
MAGRVGLDPLMTDGDRNWEIGEGSRVHFGVRVEPGQTLAGRRQRGCFTVISSLSAASVRKLEDLDVDSSRWC